MPATQPLQPDQIEISPKPELMELHIQEGIPDLTDVPEEVLPDFDAWEHSVIDYEW